MSYIGSTPVTQSFIAGTDYFNGNGSTTAFTLSRSVVSVNDIEAVINNVVQQPNTAYTVSGTTITFTSAPSAGTGNIYVRYLSTTTQSITPSQNTVSYSTLNSDNQSKLGISFKNRIINGAMVIDQRNAGASVSNGTGSFTYCLDRWTSYGSQASKFTVQQVSTAPAGFVNSLKVTSSSAYTVGASEYFGIKQIIEGYNIADLGWGTSSGKTVTLSFQVYTSLTGTFGGTIWNGANNQFYPFSYTVSSANTWTTISVTIPAPTVGSTWYTDNTQGIQVFFSLGAGSTVSGTANTWSSSLYLAPTGATSIVGTSGATFYITGVQLEVGTQATTFDYRSYGTELALCQRYYETSYPPTSAVGSSAQPQGVNAGYATSTTLVDYCTSIPFKVTKRATPTMSYWQDGGTSNVWTSAIGNLTPNNQWVGVVSFAPYYTAGAIFTTTRFYSGAGNWAASSEL
jgi:hypothetical protein